MGIVVVQSFGICVVVHGVFVAKTFVFYLLFFAVEVLIVSCLHRQNSVQCKFRMWAIFSHGVYCKNCKNFCLLPAVFRSRSFDYVVLNRQKPYNTSFVGGQVFRTAFIAKTAKTFVFYPPDCFVIVCQAVGVCLALSFSTKTVAFCFVISCLSLLWI